MKRIAAILLLGIFSFNLFGYKLVASFLESRENAKLEIALDQKEYSDDELISIKQPANLPYYNNSSTFQRIDGEIEIAGVFYKYVKCRIYNDSLEFMCIPNTAKTKIRDAKADFSKLASDFQQPGNAKKKSQPENKSFQKIIGEYEDLQYAGITHHYDIPVFNYALLNSRFVNSLFIKTAERPPDTFSSIA